MSEMEIGGPGETADLFPTLCEAPASNDDSTDPLGLFWSSEHRYCASCRGEYLDIYDGRCGACVGDDLRFCRSCGFDIAEMVNREFARRFRQASHDVAAIWSQRDLTSRWWKWQQVLKHRAGAA